MTHSSLALFEKKNCSICLKKSFELRWFLWFNWNSRMNVINIGLGIVPPYSWSGITWFCISTENIECIYWSSWSWIFLYKNYVRLWRFLHTSLLWAPPAHKVLSPLFWFFMLLVHYHHRRWHFLKTVRLSCIWFTCPLGIHFRFCLSNCLCCVHFLLSLPLSRQFMIIYRDRVLSS